MNSQQILATAMQSALNEQRITPEEYDYFYEQQAEIDEIKAQATPEGYALVPIEPTEAMIDAAMAVCDDKAVDDDYFIQTSYKAMIKAAQENEDAS